IILMFMMIVASIYTVYSLNQIGMELDGIAQHDIPLTENITKITEYYLVQANYLERSLRYGALLEQDAHAFEHLNQSIESFRLLRNGIAESISEGERLIEEALLTSLNQKTKDEFEHVGEVLNKIKTEHASFEKHSDQIFQSLLQGERDQAEQVAKKIEIEEEQLKSELSSILHEIEGFTEDAVIKADEHEHATFNVTIVLTLSAVVIGSLISWSVSRNIVKRLKETSHGLKVIASGDLTQTIVVSGRDEISNMQKSLQGMLGRLKMMISNIQSTTIQLSTAAEEVSVVTTQTSANIQQQQSETDQIATAMNEMASTVQDVAMNVSNTSNATREANVETESSREIVGDAVKGIQQLADQLESGAEVITQVEKDSEVINTVLEVIKGIAEQTNLLALNAAIEAARAGEQGRGFAVVADEVRTLAGRTQESTTEINQIIEKLQSGSKNAVQSMNLSRENAKAVVDKATMAGNSLTTIAKSASNIDQMSSQIATAAEEQSAVAEEMNRSIVRINDMTTQNATAAKQTELAGRELAQMATKLQGVVDEFKLRA
ncbi:MAG: methyl-accepting chemotaxis protein, partial [Candidatus Thiodiazotropha sp. 6PLUC5]